MMMGLVCPVPAGRTFMQTCLMQAWSRQQGESPPAPPEGRKQRLARLGLSRAWLTHDIYANMPYAGMELAAGISARLT
jgi:hypothetical protein